MMEYGAQCAVTIGEHMMQQWSVDNWDYLALVNLNREANLM